MPLRGWTNSWDIAATGVYRPGVEQAHEDQLARLRDGEPTVLVGTDNSLLGLVVTGLFLLVVAAFIFFPEQLAAIFA